MFNLACSGWIVANPGIIPQKSVSVSAKPRFEPIQFWKRALAVGNS
jgi:hypothetical protein